LSCRWAPLKLFYVQTSWKKPPKRSIFIRVDEENDKTFTKGTENTYKDDKVYYLEGLIEASV